MRAWARNVEMPSPAVLRRAVGRSIPLWLLVRALYTIVLFAGPQVVPTMSVSDSIAFAVQPMWTVRMLLIALTASLLHIDRIRAHETLLQSNFAVSSWWFVAAAFAGAGFADVALQTILRFAAAP